MQKQPMIRAVSSQDIAGIVVGPSDQKEERFRGKRGRSGAEKQDVANKRQKHDGSGPSETKSSVARKTRSKTPQTTVTTVTVGVDAREAMANKEASMNSLQFEEAQNEEAVQTGWSLRSKIDSLDEMGKIAEKNDITPTEVMKSTPCPPREKSTGSLPKTRVAAKSVRSFAEQQKKPAQNGFDNVEMESAADGKAEECREDKENTNNRPKQNVEDAAMNQAPESADDNYNIDDLSSGDETDDETQPRKRIPLWAQVARTWARIRGTVVRNAISYKCDLCYVNIAPYHQKPAPGKAISNFLRDGPLNRALEEQILHPSIDADTFFGPVRLPNLTKIFLKSRSRYAKRTSSALWTSPLSDPKPGTSKFFEALKKKRVAKPL
ncbi:unnamed protein product [Gongylonema pulchrum]|uniref:INCENP_ARK-bind domain-containing protein n=1 Tax=Gongylonema pulchrum TaxID=637853 RepID=A0A183EQP5_9BILA|nr:unnamed protein product [Gongylonema pulchrum]